jgi:hypothetical protein
MMSPWFLRKVTVTGVAAFVALLAATAGLVFDLWPELRPDPRQNFRADVEVLLVERGVTRGQTARRIATGDELDRLQDQLRAEGSASNAGHLMYVEATLEGFKRRSTQIRWSIYNGRTHQRVSSPDLGGVEGAERTAAAPADRSIQPIWLPPQFDNGYPYFVRVELFASDHTLLALDDSEPFRGFDPQR